MKKYIYIAVASLFAFVACEKESRVQEEVAPVEEPEVKELVTITASIPEDGIGTKVALEQDGDNKKLIKLKWEDGDQIVINNVTFTIDWETVSDNYKTADFKGASTPVADGGKYNISYTKGFPNKGDNYNNQTQAEDRSTSHLAFSVALNGASDYKSFSFEDGNQGGLLVESSVLRLRAKLPSEASWLSDIEKVIFKSSAAVFNGSETLTVNLTTHGSGGDEYLDVYASLPAGSSVTMPDLIVQFQVSSKAYDVYTAYREFSPEASFPDGAAHYIGIDCSNIERFANKSNVGIGESSANPYLIGDQHQMQAISLSTTKPFYKLVDDIDMTGVSWTKLNPDPYDKVINLDGNGKTISKLGTSLFDDLNGTVANFTIKDATVNGGSAITGILANTIKTASSSVTNVDITGTSISEPFSSTVTATGYTGGLIGQTEGSATISGCDVSYTSVSGTLAGGVIGFANSLVTVSDCSFSGGTVTASARFCGGFVGSTGNFSSVISDCRVENATIASSSDRVGGFVGQIQSKVQVKGCRVGTNSQRVIINTTLVGTINAGGFVGVCYGIVTKNESERSKAFTTITTKTNTGNVNVGGFVGYFDGATISYSDADAVMTGVSGQQVGGFAAWLTTKACTADNCTAKATISSGCNYAGGFIGNAGAANHTITNNASSGSVSGNATVGGFAGQIVQGNLTNNHTSCTVSAGANIGGFAGQINGDVIVSKCSSKGLTTASGNVCGGFAGIAQNGAKISDCFSTSNLSGSTRKRGGIVGFVETGTVTITRCYTTSEISANFELGGLVGFANANAITVTDCAAWNSSITASSRGADNWSTAAIVGVSYLTSTLTNNYRNPAMNLTAYWGTTASCTLSLPTSFQHPDVDSSHPLTDNSGNEVTHANNRPYHGKCEEGKTLSWIAENRLGWSSDIWDFSKDLPELK